MASQSALEILSTEIFEQIVSQIDEARDLTNFCLASRSIYQRAVPKLYQCWTYYGLVHTTKSLRSFLQTIIWRPDLAAHVRALDIREWGHCERVEDQYGCPWNPSAKFNKVYNDAEQRIKDWGHRPIDCEFEDDGAADEDYEDSDAQSYGSDSSVEGSDSSTEGTQEVELAQLLADQQHDIYSYLQYGSKHCSSNNELRTYWDNAMYLHVSEKLTPEALHILQSADIGFDLDRAVLLKHHASVYTETRNFAVLVAYLLASLPNLQHLYMVFPEPRYGSNDQDAIQRMLETSFETEENTMLEKLETLHIASALRESTPPSVEIGSNVCCRYRSGW
jgi:hypothetical protein